MFCCGFNGKPQKPPPKHLTRGSVEMPGQGFLVCQPKACDLCRNAGNKAGNTTRRTTRAAICSAYWLTLSRSKEQVEVYSAKLKIDVIDLQYNDHSPLIITFDR